MSGKAYDRIHLVIGGNILVKKFILELRFGILLVYSRPALQVGG